MQGWPFLPGWPPRLAITPGRTVPRLWQPPLKGGQICGHLGSCHSRCLPSYLITYCLCLTARPGLAADMIMLSVQILQHANCNSSQQVPVSSLSWLKISDLSAGHISMCACRVMLMPLQHFRRICTQSCSLPSMNSIYIPSLP